MKNVLVCSMVASLCFVACDTNIPNTNENTTNTQNGVITVGAFSVVSDKQVFFSVGNLQYQASTQTWRFADRQYEFVGASNQNISNTYSDWIDLFGWGTGDIPTKMSTSDDAYTVFIDWGDNAIANGGNKSNQWRTLTGQEWHYIFTQRPNATRLYGAATIRTDKADICGIVILPDEWNTPDKLVFSPNVTEWLANTFDAVQWAQMEQAGAVFLPAAGDREEGTQVQNIQSTGYYWSSTMCEDGSGASAFAFGGGEIYPSMCNSRNCGFSIRLVQDIK